MTLQEIHSFIDKLIDKEIGEVSPADKDVALDRASMWQFNEYKKDYGTTAEATEALDPFYVSLSYATDGSGLYTVPGGQNFLHLLGMDVSVTEAGHGVRIWPVEILKANKTSRLNSQLLAPSATEPVAEKTGPTSFKMYPAQLHAGTIRFLRRPAKPVYGYTRTGRQITYNSGTSTQLEWTEPYINKVIARALFFLGVNLDNNVLQQLGVTMPKANI